MRMSKRVILWGMMRTTLAALELATKALLETPELGDISVDDAAAIGDHLRKSVAGVLGAMTVLGQGRQGYGGPTA